MRHWREKQKEKDPVAWSKKRSDARKKLYYKDVSKTRKYYSSLFKEQRRMLRLQMIAAYGGCCTCCGEREPTFLTLEHIHGDGKKLRKQYWNSSLSLYRAIRREGYPKDKYTILCMNCNFARKWGTCPHQREDI